jgi:hypothetical protein
MKILKANNYIKDIDIPITVFDLKDIMIIAGLKWLKKRINPLFESIDKVGMMWPIIVTDLKYYWNKERNWPKDEQGNYKPGIAVHTGNKRVLYAIEKGYSHIEGYFVKSLEEKNNIIVKTFVNKEDYPK